MGSDTSLIERLHRLNAIGIALSAERDTSKLLERILDNARSLTHADGGTIYLQSDEDKCLNFKIMMTDSLGIHWSDALDSSTHAYPCLPLYQSDGSPNDHLVATYCAIACRTINIQDVYATDKGFDFSGTHEFDKRFGYRSRSFIAVPMANNEGDVLGVLQLINAQNPETGEVIPFSTDDQQLVESLASQAAVALTNQRFIDDQRHLFESLVKMISNVIDERSPFTAGHSKRVSALTLLLAEAAHKSGDSETHFPMEDADRYELQIAGRLHDCGKITTPDHLLDKSTKLETRFDRIKVIELRADIIKRDMQIDYLSRTSDISDEETLSTLKKKYQKNLSQLDDDLRFLKRMNIGGEFLHDEAVQRIAEIGQRQWRNHDGEFESFLSKEEISYLSVRKGTLTDTERKKINNHINASIFMLEGLRFPAYLKNVPEYAGGHHEHIDGSGYPNGLTGDDMSIPARIMAIADIFEAITAHDRPYRDPIMLSQALNILCRMRLDNHLDGKLVDLFIKEKVYMQYAEKYLHKSQIDEVDESRLPGYNPD
ncbi:MAG: HD domain-containing phosphohydrolase [Candidatus Sedimenticola sp. 20ELBAFRAG]